MFIELGQRGLSENASGPSMKSRLLSLLYIVSVFYVIPLDIIFFFGGG